MLPITCSSVLDIEPVYCSEPGEVSRVYATMRCELGDLHLQPASSNDVRLYGAHGASVQIVLQIIQPSLDIGQVPLGIMPLSSHAACTSMSAVWSLLRYGRIDHSSSQVLHVYQRGIVLWPHLTQR